MMLQCVNSISLCGVNAKVKGGQKQKEEDGPKSEDKDSNTAGTAGAHVGDTVPPEESTAFSGRASIGAHILEANEQASHPTRSVEEILGAHPIGNKDFWGGTNPSDVSIDTANSKEVTTGSHITEQHTFKFQGSVQPELLNMIPYKPHSYDLPQNYELHFLDNSNALNKLSKANNVANTPATNIFNQENQDYYNQQDQQYIGCKCDGGLEQVTIKLVPNIIIEEEKDGFYQWADQYDQWDNKFYTPVEEGDTGGPTHLMLTIAFSTSHRANKMGY